MKTLIGTFIFVFFFASSGSAQSLYSLEQDSPGSLLGGQFGFDDGPAETPEDPSAGGDDSLELRMRYPELYGGNLAAGSDAEDEAADAGSAVDESAEMQTRYPELYLNDRLYDEDSVLSIGRE